MNKIRGKVTIHTVSKLRWYGEVLLSLPGSKANNRVSLGLWSKKRTLQPGESLRLDADFSVP